MDELSKKKKLRVRDVWSNFIRRKLDKNMSKEGPRRDYNFYASTNTLYSGTNNVVYMYTIDGLPATIDMNYKKLIREKCKEDVRVSFVDMYDKTTIDWGSSRMKSRMSTWRDQSKRAREKGTDTAYEELDNLDEINQAKYREVSVSYFNSAENKRDRKVFIRRSMMYISGYRGDVFDESVEAILEVCKNLNLTVNRVETDIEMFLKSFSPFSAMLTQEAKKQMGTITLTDEIAGMFFDYGHGKVGEGTFYMGTDIHSGSAVLKYFKESSVSAENIIVSAKSGGGKSYIIKMLYAQFAAADEYRTTVMDIEGEEYLPFANYLSHSQKVVRVNMAVGKGFYCDPVEIPHDSNIAFDSGDDSGSADLYTNSVDNTAALLRVLMGIQKVEAKGDTDRVVSTSERVLNTFIQAAIITAYRRRGITQGDRSSWSRSKGMNIKDIYQEFKVLDEERQKPGKPGDSALLRALREDDVYKTEFTHLLTGLGEYFEPGGTKEEKFRNRITVSEVIDARHVICSFGFEGRSPNTFNPVDLALSQISAGYITYLRSMRCKALSKYHLKVFEELNRWGTIPGSFDILNTALTGGRKTGDVTILATNRLSSVLDNDIFGIFDNYTSFILGNLASTDTIDRVCKKLRIGNMSGELTKIMKASSVGGGANSSNSLASRKDEIARAEALANHQGATASSTDPYDKAFLIGLDGKPPVVVRAQLPSSISNSSLFVTGNKGKKNEED